MILGLFVSIFSFLEARPDVNTKGILLVMSSNLIFSTPSEPELPSSIVGTVSTRAGFDALVSNPGPLPCDWIEIRGDQLDVGKEETFSLSKDLRSRGIETIYTLRLEQEGGAVKQDDADRYQALCEALNHFSAVDIEVASSYATRLVEDAKNVGKGIILSTHNFNSTPKTEETVHKFEGFYGDHVLLKVAGYLGGDGDLWRLVDTLHTMQTLNSRKVCVMGMGHLGARSRIILAGLGSLFTYGYLDESAAPGQRSCEELRVTFNDWFIPDHSA